MSGDRVGGGGRKKTATLAAVARYVLTSAGTRFFAICEALRVVYLRLTITGNGDCNHCNYSRIRCITCCMENANHSCFTCDMRPDRTFCDLPSEALQAFDGIKELASVPRGATLFNEGRHSRGIFVLCEGRAKLSITSKEAGGKRLMLRVAGPGEVLGLSATMSGNPYEVTAEMLDDAQVAFIRRKDLLHFLREHRDACLQVVHLLSQDLHAAYDRVRSIGLSRVRHTHFANMQRAN
jgi:CRP-like cAMP-binding protein